MKAKFRCCGVDSACGRNLWQGVIFVGSVTLVISSVVLISSIGIVISMAVNDHHYNSQPMIAMNLIFALVATSTSCYQIVISLLLLWQAYRLTSKVYVCSLWYVSHLSILTVYCMLFSSKAVVSFYEKYYFSGACTIILGIIYQAVFTYFAIIVNSYLHSLDEDRYM